jgi:hypothetical protein
MARGARRFYAYQSGRLATVPDELCHVEHTRHALCGKPVDSSKVLVVEMGQSWVDLWPWCDTCRQYVGNPRDLVKENPNGDNTPATAGEETDPADPAIPAGHGSAAASEAGTARPGPTRPTRR